MKQVLYVHEAPSVGQSLKRIIQGSRLDWDVSLASNGAQALEMMRQRPFDAVVCDLHLSDISGPQVLKQARDQYPQAIRLAFSNTVNKELTMEVTKYAHQFVASPADPEEIIVVLQRAFLLGASFPQENLKKLISRLNKLPSLPTLYTAIMEEIQSPQTSVEKVGTIIERDPSMCAKILQMVNSAFFGVRQNITNPVQATSFLGVETIKDLALAMKLFAQFNSQILKELGMGSLWDHSAATALYARTIARHENQDKKMTGNSFTAGILHDIGKLVLTENFPKPYYDAIRRSISHAEVLQDAEKSVFGVSHAEVGAYLLGIWGLPDKVIEAVAYHHQPMKAMTSGFSALTAVHAANYLDHQLHPRNVQSRMRRLDMEYLQRIGLSGHEIQWEQSCLDADNSNKVEG